MQSELSVDTWQKSDTLHLIKLINLFKSKDNERINNNEMYIHVANKLFEYGISRTYIQCKTKWKELTQAYNDYKKSKTGEAPQFYYELTEILNETEHLNDSSNPFGPNWTQYETTFLIKAMKLGDFLNKLKIEEPLAVYEEISQYLHKVGPIARSKEDIQQRWKNLKQSYIKYIKGDLLHFKYFEIMDALLDWEPNNIAFEEDQFKDGHEYGISNYENSDDFETQNAPSSKRSLNWTHKETEILLDIVQKHCLKTLKRDEISSVFDEISMQLRLQGFKRSAEQCRVKFKHLKVKYFAALKKNDNPEHYFYHFDKMKAILQGDKNFGNDSEQYFEIEYLEDEVDSNFEKIFIKDENNYYPKHNHRKGRAIWSRTETKFLLRLIKAKNVKRYCRRETFEEIAFEMTNAGYKRSSQMCMVKWKNLRNQLYSCIRNMVDGKEELCPFYDEICEIVQKNGQVDISLISDQNNDESDESEDQFDADESENQDLLPEKSSQIDSKKRPHLDENSLVIDKRFKPSQTSTDVLNNEDETSKLVCNYKMDDIEHYCMSLSATFKRLPKRKQSKLKIEIQKLLYTAEYDENF